MTLVRRSAGNCGSVCRAGAVWIALEVQDWLALEVQDRLALEVQGWLFHALSVVFQDRLALANQDRLFHALSVEVQDRLALGDTIGDQDWITDALAVGDRDRDRLSHALSCCLFHVLSDVDRLSLTFSVARGTVKPELLIVAVSFSVDLAFAAANRATGTCLAPFRRSSSSLRCMPSPSCSLQNGWANYSGEADIEITNIYAAAYNDFNGYSYPGWANVPSIGIASDGLTQYRALVRFSGLAAVLPPGAIVSRATLSVSFRQYSSGFTIEGRYLLPGVRVARLPPESPLQRKIPGCRLAGQLFVERKLLLRWRGHALLCVPRKPLLRRVVVPRRQQALAGRPRRRE